MRFEELERPEKYLLFLMAGSCKQICKLRSAFRKSARFVKNDSIKFMRPFKGFPAFYKDSVFRTSAGADHNGGRGCKPDCTRTGDYKDQ